MAVPDFQSFLLPLLKLAGDGNTHTLQEAIELLAQEFHLSPEDRMELNASGQTRLYNRVAWASTYLRKAALLASVRRGSFQITERGREVLAEPPTRIDLKFLQRYKEIAEFRREQAESPPAFNESEGVWIVRPEGEGRIREKVEGILPNEVTRLCVLQLIALALENAAEERGDAWHLRERAGGLRLMTGGLLAFGFTRKKVQLSVMGPISDATRASVGADEEDDEEFKAIPGALTLELPVERAAEVNEELRNALSTFVDLAMARVRRPSGFEHHVPDAVAYLATALERELPQPEPSAEEADDEAQEPGDPAASRQPCVRGRAQRFERGERTIGSLLSDVERGAIALPDLQRPFVWEDTKVRDLLDSLFLGFPVGTLVLWHTATEKESRALGAEKASLRATSLVIDGQQRLTSLVAVMRGGDVVGKDGQKRKITIAFRPRDGRFEVADAAIRSDPEFLPSITTLWADGRRNSQIRKELINNLRDGARLVDDVYEDAVEQNLEVASGMLNYRFPTIDIREGATVDSAEFEEAVADIFVRINNQGKRLGQADFVLTLLSVFHGELRDRIEERARAMSGDGLVAIDPQQLLRAACGVAFDRARMSAIYRSLRGVDPATGEADPASRAKVLARMDDAAKACMEPTPWRDYLLRVKHAGFVSPSLISSKNAIVNAYALYVRGKRTGVVKSQLDELTARWVFGSLLTARYSGSSETAFEQDLSRVSDLPADAFVRALDDALGQTVTGDYWTHSLVGALMTQKSRASAALAFRAAQIVLGTRGLFSDLMMRDLLDPPAIGGRAASEIHHLFPVAWLNGHGVRDRRRQNQVANLADVGWHENNVIGAQSPAKYVPRLREQLRLDDDKWGRTCAEHALPIGWETMEYDEFLAERRRRMADIIRVAFRKLGGENDAPTLEPPWFVPGAESVWRNIVETEQALRAVVRQVYSARFGETASTKIVEALPETARETLARALRSRPAGSDPLSVVDYLYIAQLPPLLFAGDVWQEARQRLGGAPDLKQRLSTAMSQITPVRNEIAHVREVEPDRLIRANLACNEVRALARVGVSR